MIALTIAVVKEMDFSEFKYYVECGGQFDADDYAESNDLNRADIDPDDVHAGQDAAAQLNAGEWLAVSHEAG